MENDCIDCKKNTNERFVRWQQITLKELGKVISLFLGIEFATIGFVVTQLTSLNLTCKNYWSVFLMMLGTVLLLINIIMFLYLTLNRLTDFRKTTQKIKAEKDKIIAFNDLPADGEISVGEEIVIPGGQGEAPKPAAPSTPSPLIDKRQYANSAGGTPQISGGTILSGKGGTGHRFPYGYCTWYVAQKRYVPWGGNAGSWLYNAKSAGYATGKTPRAGAIVVTTENRYYGHVAIVEKVSGDTITVSEMNYVGFAKRSTRTLSASSRAIKGFIY